MAKFYWFAWSMQQLYSQKVWFQIQRTAMVMAFVLTIVVVCLAFVYHGWWSMSMVASVLAYLGIIVVILVVIHPSMALFCPHPGPLGPLGCGNVCLYFSCGHSFSGSGSENIGSSRSWRRMQASILQPLARNLVDTQFLWLAWFSGISSSSLCLKSTAAPKHKPGWSTRFWNNKQ